MKKYGAVLLAFLLCAAIFTYISGQVYQDSLPVVTAEATFRTQMRYQWELTGIVEHQEAVTYSAPVQMQIIEKRVRAGEWVKAGTPLLRLDSEQLHIQWLQCKLREEMLAEQIEDSKSYQKELLEYELAALQQTIVQVETLEKQAGWIYSEQEGVVLSVSGSDTVNPKGTLVRIGPADGVKEITFPMTQKQASYCKDGYTIYLQATLDEKELAFKLTEENAVYDTVQQSWQCVLRTQEPIAIRDGQGILAEFSPSSPVYHAVIPNSAIVSNNNGHVTYYVLKQKQTTIGTEYYVQLKNGQVLEQDDTCTALYSSEEDPVVNGWSKPLSNGTTVRLIEFVQ